MFLIYLNNWGCKYIELLYFFSLSVRCFRSTDDLRNPFLTYAGDFLLYLHGAREHHLRAVEQFPDSGDLLRIEDGIYRMWIGEYRALFKVYDHEKIIVVLAIDLRGKVYKSL
jgi:mRNA-degrading endonuclease RelE of RelBE toxin-antitoxin system